MSDNVEINEYDEFADCDGKKCGLGKHVGGGNYICIHNNLRVKHPELIIQWHPDNKPMENYSSGSAQKVLWICGINFCQCHIWEAEIRERTRTGRKPSGCPYCKSGKICEHNNLEVLFPHLKIEWDPNNSKKISEYTYRSNAIVSWVCSESQCSCHKWKTAICNRTKKDKPSGCPFCSKFTERVCEHNNLEVLFPQLKCEWHPDNPKLMKDYSYGSSDIVSWICQKSKCKCHIWATAISHRTKKVDPSGCPFCNSSRVCEHNNLEIDYPELKIEWHPDNPGSMKEFGSGSIAIVKWMCSKNPAHIWSTAIHARTAQCKDEGNKCPHCSKSKGYSKAEINWLTSLEQKENIVIRNALSPEGQFKITGKIKADGYCEATNTVYEFHGDFWHGNPSIYDRNEINPITKSTFGELYDKTIAREQKIRDLGYNLIVKWESDAEPKVEELEDDEF